MAVMFKGRRLTFGLYTANEEAASGRARDIYVDLIKLGVDATLAKHKATTPDPEQLIPEAAEPKPDITIGKWLALAEAVFVGKPGTFGGYVRCLRSIASHITGLKKSKKRFAGKGNEKYRRRIDSAPLSILSPAAIQKWRKAMVAAAGKNPAAVASTKISVDSMIRQASALFSVKITKYIERPSIPNPVPFQGVEYFGRHDMRYNSKIDASKLLKSALSELAEADPEVFKVFLLAIGAGMRRGEIANLLWCQVDAKLGAIGMEITEDGDLKTKESAGVIFVDATFMALLESYRPKATGRFVIECPPESEGGSRRWGQQYRCHAVLQRAITWLRAHGDDMKKPLHTLRKEAGSLVSTKSGIHAAAGFLRQKGIRVAAMHYVSHKEKVVVDIAGLVTQPD